MFCRNCGSNIDDRAVICPHCGVPTNNMPQPATPLYNQQPRANGLGIAGFILSLIGLCGGNIIIFIPGIVGLILSIIGLAIAKRNNMGSGLAIAGIAISAISFIFWIYVWVIALIDVANSVPAPII